VATLGIDRVTKRFGGLVAVDDVSLTASSGSITALIGPNGAGKTTLFNVITGFERAERGSIVFEGQRIARPSPWRMARLGMVRTFQTPVGFPKLSVWENLLVGGCRAGSESLVAALAGPRVWRRDVRGRAEEAERLLAELDLWGARDSLLEDLSAGETKLVEFARQLMARPRMLLLDEPASGVDPAHIERLAELITELNERGIAILIIDHNLSFILSIAHVVYVLAEGQVISKGNPETVARDPRVVETYLGEVA